MVDDNRRQSMGEPCEPNNSRELKLTEPLNIGQLPTFISGQMLVKFTHILMYNIHILHSLEKIRKITRSCNIGDRD